MEPQDTAATVAAPKLSSFMTRMTNVFASPSELYTEVAALPVQKSSWVIPFVFSLLLAFIITYVLYSNESLRHQIYDIQMRGVEKAVQEGRMTETQAERVREQMEGSGPTMFMLIGGGFAVVMVTLTFFGAALFLWLATKFGLKAAAGYSKFLEVSGLASLIAILGTIVLVLMMNAFDSLYASPSLALAVLDSYDSQNKLHVVMSSLNVFSIWEVAVLGLGLSKISGKSTSAGMGVAFGLWILWVVISTLLGLGIR